MSGSLLTLATAPYTTNRACFSSTGAEANRLQRLGVRATLCIVP